jgi:hypothetical protein
VPLLICRERYESGLDRIAVDVGKRFLVGTADPGMLDWSDEQWRTFASRARARHKAAKTTGPFQVDHTRDYD